MRCIYHCSGCGSHFRSLQAFDAHRSGRADERMCWAESNEQAAQLVSATDHGICDQTGHIHKRVTIWRDPKGMSDVRARFARRAARTRHTQA
jgi:hypothetical protein